MCLYERIAYIVTLVHLCMNEIKYEHMLSKSVYVKCLLICMYTHLKTCPLFMYDHLVNRGDLEGVLKCILN